MEANDNKQNVAVGRADANHHRLWNDDVGNDRPPDSIEFRTAGL